MFLESIFTACAAISALTGNYYFSNNSNSSCVQAANLNFVGQTDGLHFSYFNLDGGEADRVAIMSGRWANSKIKNVNFVTSTLGLTFDHDQLTTTSFAQTDFLPFIISNSEAGYLTQDLVSASQIGIDSTTLHDWQLSRSDVKALSIDSSSIAHSTLQADKVTALDITKSAINGFTATGLQADNFKIQNTTADQMSVSQFHFLTATWRNFTAQDLTLSNGFMPNARIENSVFRNSSWSDFTNLFEFNASHTYFLSGKWANLVFQDSVFTDVTLAGISFSNVKFQNTKFVNSRFFNDDLTGATFGNGVQFINCTYDRNTRLNMDANSAAKLGLRPEPSG